MSARVPREDKDVKVETVKTDVVPSDDGMMAFEQMAENLKKVLTEPEKVEFTKIITDFSAAKTVDDTIAGLVRSDSLD